MQHLHISQHPSNNSSTPDPTQPQDKIRNAASQKLSRDMKATRHSVCATLGWSVLHSELRQWIDIIVTRMSIQEAFEGKFIWSNHIAVPYNRSILISIGTTYEGWTDLYFDAEAEAATRRVALNYLFDLYRS